MTANGESVKARPQEVTLQNISSYSAWFKDDTVNAIEKRAVPEYFTGQNQFKTPEAYKAIRDFIIDSYRRSPEKYLECTSSIHALLEQWGLINHQVESKQRPQEFKYGFHG